MDVLVALLIGFVCGYGVRELIGRRRRSGISETASHGLYQGRHVARPPTGPAPESHYRSNA